MSRPVTIGAVILSLLSITIAWRINQSSGPEELPFEAKNKPAQAAPMCPWREAENDLKSFFPEATRCQLETRILSGQRLELAERLGRAPTGDENVLPVHRVYRNATPLGAVLTRRVKGAYGAIELVLAVGMNGQTRALRLQRLREPEAIAAALQNSEWLSAFAGRSAEELSQADRYLPELPPEARASAAAVIEGARSLLVLLAVSDERNSTPHGAAHHH